VAIEVEEDGPAVAPVWIITFSDMISLLVTFFILLMTFSSLDAIEMFKVREGLIGTLGVIKNTGGPTAAEPPAVDLMAAMDAVRGAAHPHSRPVAELAETLVEMGQKQTPDHVAIDLNRVADGLVVRFDQRASFGPGSAELSPWLAGALGEISQVLAAYPHLVLVEGFADSRFQPTPTHPTPEALGLARAAAAARALVAGGTLSPLRVQLAGSGTHHPVADDDTAAGRERNRRVELRILTLSRARQALIETREEG